MGSRPTTCSSWRKCRGACWSAAAAISRSNLPASSTASAPMSVNLYRGHMFLRGFDGDVRETLAEEMTKTGIDLRFNTIVKRIEKTADGLIAHLSDGEYVECDHVLYAIGRRPNTGDLGLEDGGRADPGERRHRGRRRLSDQHRDHLRDRRRDRPGQPDAGRDCRGALAGRHPLRPRAAAGRLRHRAERRVLAATGRHGRPDRSRGAGEARQGRRLSLNLPADEAHAVRPRREDHDEAGGRWRERPGGRLPRWSASMRRRSFRAWRWR